MTRVGALWIGGLEAYMDENFLRQAMAQLGQEGIVSIKVATFLADYKYIRPYRNPDFKIWMPDIVESGVTLNLCYISKCE